MLDRLFKIASVFSQGLNPREHIDDYGDDEGDYNADEAARSWETSDVDDDSREYDFPIANRLNRLFSWGADEDEDSENEEDEE